MSFLAPLFLLGAAAVALPILFHLIRRSTKEKLPFSSLMFLSQSPPRVTKRSRLEHLLLLLARCAILLLLSTAFARPFVRKPVATTPVEQPGRRVVILVDISASMKRGAIWSSAKTKTLEHLVASPNDHVAVLAFGDEVRALLSFEEARPLPPGARKTLVQSRLDSIQPGWSATHLDRGLVRAAELLIEEGNKDASQKNEVRGEIVVVSDFQSGARVETLQGFEWPKLLSVTLDAIKHDEPSNASMQVLGDTFTRLGTTNNTLRLRVQNNIGAKKEQFEIAWTRGHDAASGKQLVYVPAGQARVSVAPVLPLGEPVTEMTLSGDNEAFDNRTFYIPGERKTATVIYYGKDEANDPQGLYYYIKRGFEDTSAGAVRVARGGDSPASPSMAVVGTAIGTEDVTSLRAMLNEGKSVLIAARDAGALAAWKQLTTNLTLNVMEAPPKNFHLFGTIDFNHPLFAPFADAKFSDFTRINFWKYRAIDLAGMTNINIPARFDSGDPALVDFTGYKGHLYLLASSWAPVDSQFALSSKFVPILFTMLEQGGALYQSTPQYLVGQIVNLPDGAVLTGPGADWKAGDKTFVPREPGIYSLDGRPAFAVNLDPAESRISPLGVDQLQALGVPLKAAEPTLQAVAQAKLQKQQLVDSEVESRQKFWRLLVLAAIGLVLLETILATRATTRSVPA